MDPSESEIQAPSALQDPSQQQPRRRTGMGLIVAAATVLTLGIVASGIAVGIAVPDVMTAAPQISEQPSIRQSESQVTAANYVQKIGVVTILTNLYYEDAYKAAGTGMIITSDGRILTNNHVIEGATSIEVTVEASGETYTASVIGSDAVDDVAVLQLDEVSTLDAVRFDGSGLVQIGDPVVSVGNADGAGDLVAAVGTISGADKIIAVGTESGDRSVLTHLYEVDAEVVSGDSGGPLFDADGEVIGIITAASSGTRQVTGYAIEIGFVLDIVDAIESGVESGNIVIGPVAFLGVSLSNPVLGAPIVVGAVVAGVTPGTPADAAGLVTGIIITAVNGAPVPDNHALSAIVQSYEPGDRVTLTYTDAAGATRTVALTLVAGPAS